MPFKQPRPANAADEVNYSDFLESVKKGDVEMVRVQNDMLSAQYTTKDGPKSKVTPLRPFPRLCHRSLSFSGWRQTGCELDSQCSDRG